MRGLGHVDMRIGISDSTRNSAPPDADCELRTRRPVGSIFELLRVHSQ